MGVRIPAYMGAKQTSGTNMPKYFSTHFYIYKKDIGY
jgi:hypothetical protein